MLELLRALSSCLACLCLAPALAAMTPSLCGLAQIGGEPVTDTHQWVTVAVTQMPTGGKAKPCTARTRRVKSSGREPGSQRQSALPSSARS